MSAETSTSLFWWNVWIGAATVALTESYTEPFSFEAEVTDASRR